MKDGLQIIHAVRSDGFAGVERFVLHLARTQAAAGHRVHVIGGDPERMAPELAEAGVGHTAAARTGQVIRSIARLRHDADVVNTHMTAADLAATFALRTVAKRPAVVSTRHFARRRGRIGPVTFDRLVKRTIDAEVSISHAVAAAIGVPSIVVHSGVTDRPDSDPRARGATVLMAQRLEPEKRTEVGISAFATSGIAAHGWSLEIAGEGADYAALRAQVAALGLNGSVHFLGFRRDVARLMSTSGILLAPCPIEGFGLSVVEAMAAGLPVIAAAGGGHAETLADLDSRALFTVNDAEAAATRLRSLAGDEAGRAALGAQEQLRQRAMFSVQAQAKGTDAVYGVAMAARQGQRQR